MTQLAIPSPGGSIQQIQQHRLNLLLIACLYVKLLFIYVIVCRRTRKTRPARG